MTPFGFTRVNVAEVNFHERHGDRHERITKCETGVGVGAGINHDAINITAPRVQLIDELSFSIMLCAHQRNVQFCRNPAQALFDLREGRVPIDGRLSDAEKIQIGSVEQADFHALFSPLSQAENCARSSLTG